VLALVSTLLAYSLVAQPDGEARLRPSVGVSVGYSAPGELRHVVCLAVQTCSEPAYAQGVDVGLLAQALYGEDISVGVQGQLAATVGQSFGLSTSVLGLVRFGRSTFADVGAGVGYVWAEGDANTGAQSEGEVGAAFGLRLGTSLAESLALVARGDMITSTPGKVSASVGLEWRL
jgi:hypothetical protein